MTFYRILESLLNRELRVQASTTTEHDYERRGRRRDLWRFQWVLR
eukprot:COSAG03_NODE_12637_length_538_cov_0.915718_1_plen_44_part_10